jgi:C4-dicarboxylate-specific signal transduction histidine kinase
MAFNVDAQIQSYLVSFFRSQARSGSVVYVLLPLLLMIDHRMSEDSFFAVATAALLFTSACRVVMAYNKSISDQKFVRIYSILIIINSLAVAPFSYLIFSKNPVPLGPAMIYVLFVASITAATFVALAGLPILASANATLLLAPLVIGILGNQGQIENAYLMATAIFLLIPFGVRQLQQMRAVLKELNKSQHAAFAQHRRTQKFIEQMPGVVSWFDKDLNYVDCNQALLDQSGMRKEDLIGKSVGFRNPQGSFTKALNEFAKDGQSHRIVELRVAFKETTKYFFTLLSRFESLDRLEYIAVSFDITSLKDQERDLERQKIELLHQEKLISLGELASGIAHEINNPLSIIIGKVDILSKAFQSSPVEDVNLINKHLQSIKTTSLRIAKIVGALKQLTRDSRLDNISTYSIQEVLEPVYDLYVSKLSNAGIELKIEVPDQKLRVRCSLLEISQVLLNLLINASHAVESLEKKWIQISVETKGEVINISITDSGAGIEMSNRSKIFQPFFTTKAPNVGTGIGLSLSKELMKKHGGDLYCDHQSPYTRFVIILPAEFKTDTPAA